MAHAQFKAAERAKCQPGDLAETGLQGQVPRIDRATTRASQGYQCNLTQIGNVLSVASDPSQSRTSGGSTLDTYKSCAYYHDAADSDSHDDGGTVVIDASDPTKPKQSAYLQEGAMRGAWESLRVSTSRGLLIADHQTTDEILGDDPGTSPLTIYDVSKDCANPKLVFNGIMPTGAGHEGWLTPDGTV